MTTSGTTTFTADRNQIIRGALRLVGALAQGEVPTSDQYTEASEALNMMVKAWMADGLPIWAMTQYAVPLTANKTSYRIGTGQEINISKPLKVVQAFLRDITSNVDIPMRIITKQEYNILGNKSTTGQPVQIYYDPLRDYGDLYLFPTPDTTSAGAKQVYIIYQRMYEDFDTTTDTPDFPQEWLEALKYGLAVRLSAEYGVPVQERGMLRQEAEIARATALSFGTEEGSLYFQREFRNW